MTSSNAAATDEARRAATGSPPPAASTAISPSADAAGLAAPASVMPNANPNPNPDAPTPALGLDTTNETETVQQPAAADFPVHFHPDQPFNGLNTDLPIPSPPTVSPLSTPAATHVNADENLADDIMSKFNADLPPLSLIRDSSTFRSGVFDLSQTTTTNATSATDQMQLGEPFVPNQAGYHQRDQVQAIATTDPDPNGADYSHNVLSSMRRSQGSIDPNTYIMNLAAQATLFQDQGPSVIAPSAVSLHSFTQDSDVLTGSVEPTSTSGSQKLESFARIEFADSTFQMTTYAVIIGRDQQAMEQARADEKREAAYRRKCEENERNGLPPPTPIMHDRGKFSKSYVSEEGGMLGPEHSDGEQDVRPVKRRRPSSANQSSAGEDNASGDHVQSNRQYVSHTPGAAAVDLGVLQPSPEHIPFIGIHSPGPDIASKTRGISRQHLKIQFNKERGAFEGIALHKNGFFCQDILYGLDRPATLRSGDRLQIKDVEFFFVINGVQIGMSGGEDEEASSSKRMSVGGKEMSLDFEHSDHENFGDTSDELSDVENIPTPTIESDNSEERPQPAATQPVANEGQQPLEVIKSETEGVAEISPEFAMPEIPKRRGPGRPPKDGIMSKRERRLLKKQMQETSKKTLPQEPESEKIKRPVGRPRKNPLPEDGERAEKRKYNKKKREDGEEGSDVEKRVKEKKDKKVRPKSPPLDLRIEDYTAEQLAKPTKNYGVMIDDVLTNGPPDGLTLKQIYKRITLNYPWFYFTAETKGWESSVRHNLIGNDAFLKDEETGLWSRVPGVELDAGKKRKANSPDRHLGPSQLHSHLSHPPYYQTSPYANPSSVPYAHGLPAYASDPKHPQPSYTTTTQNAQPQAASSQPVPQPVTQPVYTAQTPAPAQLPPGYGASAVSRPPNASQQSTYSSPYARPPPPPANPPVKAETSIADKPSSTTPSAPQSAAPAQYQQSRPSNVNTGPREQLSPDIEKAIMQFSANMLNVISKQTPHAASIIEAAVSRVRGLPVQNKVPGFESVENTLINAMQGMIKDMQGKHRNTTSASPAPTATVQATATPSPAPANTAEAEIQRRLKNFRESMVTALRTKTDKAEIIVDSAINRAQGLPHAGKIPGWEEADNLMVKSVTQIIAEARSAYSLRNQYSSPAPGISNRPVPVSQPVQPSLRAEPSASPAPVPTPVPKAASPVPPNGTSAAGHAPAHQPVGTSASNSIPSAMARPGVPLPRPAPVSFTRPPTTSPMARPAVTRKEPGTILATQTAPAPAAPRPNVSSPAPPSAGVLDQITSQKRFTDDAFHKNNGFNVGNNNNGTSGTTSTYPSTTTSTSVASTAGESTAHTASNTAGNAASNSTAAGNISSNNITSSATSTTASNIGGSTTRCIANNTTSTTTGSSAGDSTGNLTNNNLSLAAGTSVGPVPPGEVRNTASAENNNSNVNSVRSSMNSSVENEKDIPSKTAAIEHVEAAAFKAPTSIHNLSSPAPPSAGVVDQIAGHKRSLDEGPGSGSTEQPESKRFGVSPA
ncbi:hypothetical protein F5Y19DRAFT_415131 [Xylariaceae sp. FL1651]|nr:hypothetical protein F5Y19DRAFT_415131 [Xylariaceae sp. FL1651]